MRWMKTVVGVGSLGVLLLTSVSGSATTPGAMPQAPQEQTEQSCRLQGELAEIVVAMRNQGIPQSNVLAMAARRPSTPETQQAFRAIILHIYASPWENALIARRNVEVECFGSAQVGALRSDTR